MNKLLASLSIILSISSASAYAEYQFSLPVEQKNHGFLPDHSIVFVGGNTPVEPEVPEVPETVTVCAYDQSDTFYRVRNITNATVVQWGGTPISVNGDGKYVLGDYTFTKGTQKTSGVLNYFELCKTGPKSTGTWIAASTTISSWTNSGAGYNFNWSPDPSNFPSGTTFTQTSTGYSQDQKQTVQNRERNTFSLEYRNVGNPITNTQTLSIEQTTTRDSVGTKVGNGSQSECLSAVDTAWGVATSPANLVGTIAWKGVIIFSRESSGDFYGTSVQKNGVTYTRGNQIDSATYEVCQHY